MSFLQDGVLRGSEGLWGILRRSPRRRPLTVSLHLGRRCPAPAWSEQATSPRAQGLLHEAPSGTYWEAFPEPPSASSMTSSCLRKFAKTPSPPDTATLMGGEACNISSWEALLNPLHSARFSFQFLSSEPTWFF